MATKTDKYDVFFSHSHTNAETVDIIARKLQDDFKLRIWLDKWILIPGEPFRQAMSKGLDEAKTCAVFVGNDTPKGWFEEEISKALNKQTKFKSFRVIPVLLPDGDSRFVKDFLELRTWVNFMTGIDNKRVIHELVCGILGKAPGRDFEKETSVIGEEVIKRKLIKINKLHADKLIEKSIKIEFQRILLNELLIDKKNEN